MPAAHQAEFARLIGVDRSHVTRLKQEGRLVMTSEGKVDIEASRQRILETAGGRDDVSARWARARGAEPATAPPAQPQGVPAGREDDDPAITTRADAISRKEHYLALHAKLDYEKAIRAVVNREDVAEAFADVMILFRQLIENQAHRVAALLVQKDIDFIRATLKQDSQEIISSVWKEADKREKEMGIDE